MKQNPSRTKFKKSHKPSFSNLYLTEQKSFYPLKGSFCLKSMENGKLTYNQIEACRKSVRRMLKKQALVFLRIFTNISITKKPVATRMGKGKGSHHKWISIIKKGQVICEVVCPNFEMSSLTIKALKAASSKLPVKSVISYNYY